MNGSNQQVPDTTDSEPTASESALSRAADMGPLPGIVDENEERAVTGEPTEDDPRTSEDERAPDAPVGQRPDDEVKEALGFMGVRSA